MPIKSRWVAPVPNCSLQKWVFGSPFDPLPDRKAFIDPEQPESNYLTFANYRLLSKRIAVGLQASGLKPGDRVLVFSANSLFFPAVFLGILMAGGIFTGANPGYVARELAFQLRDSGATLMIAQHGVIDVAIEAARQASMTRKNIFAFDSTTPDSAKPENPPTQGTRHWTELIAPVGQGEAFAWVEPTDARTATVCLNYSSGTTGVPKGVEISHYNYVANGVGVTKVSKLRPDHAEFIKRSAVLCFLPLYHSYGQTYFVANFPYQGVPVYIMPKFDLPKLLTYIEQYRVTHLVAVPPILVALAKHPLSRKFDLSSLEQVGSGGAPLAPEIAGETEKLLGRDMKVRQGWGMTELTCTSMAWDPSFPSKSRGVGELMPNCQAKLVDIDGKREITTPNTRGELWVAGPILMRGYWKNPEATKETIVVDHNGVRWLRTGDIACVEEYEAGALFFIVDRLKELIKVRGFQVAPAELEALLLGRRDISDAGVVGVTIEGEEVPRAYVVKAPGSRATEKDIARWMESKVAKHKRLRGGVIFVESIPKTPSGKILRKILREKARQEVGDRPPRDSKLS